MRQPPHRHHVELFSHVEQITSLRCQCWKKSSRTRNVVKLECRWLPEWWVACNPFAGRVVQTYSKSIYCLLMESTCAFDVNQIEFTFTQVDRAVMNKTQRAVYPTIALRALINNVTDINHIRVYNEIGFFFWKNKINIFSKIINNFNWFRRVFFSLSQRQQEPQYITKHGTYVTFILVDYELCGAINWNAYNVDESSRSLNKNERP